MSIGVFIRRVRILVTRSATEFARDHGTAMAAAISYYVLFSLFPLLIFAIGLTGLAIQDDAIRDDLIAMVLEHIPFEEGADAQFVESIERIEAVGSGAFGLAGFLGLAWSGSNMFAIMRRTMNVAFDVHTNRPFLRQKLVDFAMMGIVGIIFLGSLVITGVLRATRAFAADTPVIAELSAAMGWGWDIASFFIPVLVSLSAFFIIYWFLPATAVRVRDALIGALVAALAFEGGKIGFSTYLEHFGNYNAIYGSVGTVVIFLFWVFISANILLFCAELTSELPRVMAGDYDDDDVPTAESLLPWHVRARRIVWRILRNLIFYEPDDDEEDNRRRT